MPYKKILPVLILCFAVFAGCKKNSENINCESLKNALVANDKETVRSIVNQTIKKLSSREHNAKNLEKLAEKLSAGCSITAEVICVFCIYTYPPQSEIQVTFTQAGSTHQKIIDIINTSDSSTMKFANFH
jgi:hypothetical protein